MFFVTRSGFYLPAKSLYENAFLGRSAIDQDVNRALNRPDPSKLERYNSPVVGNFTELKIGHARFIACLAVGRRLFTVHS